MSVFVVGGAAAGVAAAVAIPTVVGVGGAVAMGAAGAALGSHLSSKGKKAPRSASSGVNYDVETLYDKLMTQSDPALASAMYNREANEHYGRPAYARLEQGLMRDAIVGKQQLVDADGYYTDTTMPEIPVGGKVLQNEDEIWESYVFSNPDLREDFENLSGGGIDVDIVQYGKDHYEQFGKAEGRQLAEKGTVVDGKGATVPMNEERVFVGKEYAGQKINTGGTAEIVGGNQQRDFYDEEGNRVTRRAGFDEDGNFQGTAQLATDIGFDTQQQIVQQELGLIEQHGQRATEAYRDQGDIRGALNKVRVMDELSANDGLSRSALHMNDAYAQPSAAQGAAGQLHQRAQAMGGGGSDEMNAASGVGQAAASAARGSKENPMTSMGEFLNSIVDKSRKGTQGYGQRQQQPQGGTTAGLRSSMLNEAITGMHAGGGLTDRERRAATQTARSAMQSRGRLMDFGGIMAEMEMNERYQRQRMLDRQNFAGQVMNAEQGLMDRQTARDQLFQSGLAQDRQNAANRVGIEQSTSADPYKAILGKDSGAGLAAGTNLYAGVGSAKTASPNLYNPHTGLQFEQQQAVNVDNYNAAKYAADKKASSGLASGLLNAAATVYANS